MADPHVPILTDDMMKLLDIQDSDFVVDGTLGFGGHSSAVLAKLSTGKLLGIDRDINAIQYCQERFKGLPNFMAVHERYSLFPQVLAQQKWPKVDVMILDLGVSSYQFDTADRGFSFRFEGPLDMRMGKSEMTAADILNQYSSQTLSDMFFQYGELRQNQRLVAAIIAKRAQTPIETVQDLLSLIKQSYFFRNKRSLYIKTVSQVFQALRIEVNQELDELETFLGQLESHVNPGARIGILSFHSLEDRLIKQFVKNHPHFLALNQSVIKADKAERTRNPRSRSAKLRCFRYEPKS